MTDDPRPRDDRTREITLPPLPDRPPSALPREWAELAQLPDAPARLPEPPQPDASAPEADVPAPTSGAAGSDTPTLRAFPGEDPRLTEQPTDKVGSPRLRVRPPERTLAFSSPEMVNRPVEKVQVGRAARRWPWVVLTLVPILIIVGAGIALVLLLR